MRLGWVLMLLALAVVALGQTVDRSNPQALVNSFLDAYESGDIEGAAEALEQGAITNQGIRDAAESLGYVFHQLGDSLAVPAETEETRLVLNRYENERGQEIGELILTEQAEGWLISEMTVRDAQAIADEVRRRAELAVQAEEQSGEANEDVPAGLRSPRATIGSFLDAMNRGNAAEAVKTLDMTAYPVLTRMEQGQQVANLLLAILNRTEVINLDDVPDAATGDAYVLATYRSDDGGIAGTIAVAPQDDGSWKFSSDSIASLDDIWEVVKDREVIAGLKDVQLEDLKPSEWLLQRMPESWQRPGLFGLKLGQIFALLLLLAGAWILGQLIRGLVRLLVKVQLRLEFDLIPDGLVRRFGRGISIAVAAQIVRWGLPYVGLPPVAEAVALTTFKVIEAAGLVFALWVLWDAVALVAGNRAENRSKKAATIFVPILKQMGRLAIGIGVLIYALTQFGVNVTGLVAGLGIGGAIIALAAKDSVENIFGSLTVLFEAPYGIGDWVQIEDIDGEVEEIGVRTTRIRTFEDAIVVMPNSKLIKTSVKNYGRRRRRRLKTTLGLAYDTPPAKVEQFCEGIRARIKERDDMWSDKPFVFFSDFGDSALEVMLYCFIEQPTWERELRTRDEFLREIMHIAEDLGVEFAFPTRTIHIAPDSWPDSFASAPSSSD